MQAAFFSKISNNFKSDFLIIGILAHELGHGAGYFSSKKIEENYKAKSEDIALFEKEILLPFYQCYTDGDTNLDYARIQYQESRSDYIAYLVMKDFFDALKLKDDSIYLEMINLFKKHTSEKMRSNVDPHPFFKHREKIVSGHCKLESIYPYTRYNEGL